MLIKFFQLCLIGFVVLTVLYFLASYYFRSLRRSALKREWVEEGSKGDMDAFVDKGLEDYEGSLRSRLILGIYIVPPIVFFVILYLVNFS